MLVKKDLLLISQNDAEFNLNISPDSDFCENSFYQIKTYFSPYLFSELIKTLINFSIKHIHIQQVFQKGISSNSFQKVLMQKDNKINELVCCLYLWVHMFSF